MAAAHALTARLFNTFEPVTTFYRDLFPHWVEQGWQVEAVISRAEYRPGRERNWAEEGVSVRWMPGARLKATGRLNKFLIMILYVLGAAVHTLFGPAVDRNLFAFDWYRRHLGQYDPQLRELAKDDLERFRRANAPFRPVCRLTLPGAAEPVTLNCHQE